MPEVLEQTDLAIHDVKILNLVANNDSRGTFTEIFRHSWADGIFSPLQWNVVRSEKHVLRGFHCHKLHTDYLTVASGKAGFFLKDLRISSGTFQKDLKIFIDSSEPKALIIPPGVGHAFWFLEESMHIYSVSHYWNEDDEFGCFYGDPELGIELDFKPNISDRDMKLGSYHQLVEKIN